MIPWLFSHSLNLIDVSFLALSQHNFLTFKSSWHSTISIIYNTGLAASSFVQINLRCAACEQSLSNETKYWDPVSVFVEKGPHTSE